MTRRIRLLALLMATSLAASGAPNGIVPADLPQVQSPTEYREIRVPTEIHAWRTAKVLAVEENPEPMETVKVLVDRKAVLMTYTKYYFYPAVEVQPQQPTSALLHGGTPWRNVFFHRARPMGNLIPGQAYTMTLEISVVPVTTRIPRFWVPGPNDPVVWQKTFRITPAETPNLPPEIQKFLDEHTPKGPPFDSEVPVLPLPPASPRPPAGK